MDNVSKIIKLGMLILGLSKMNLAYSIESMQYNGTLVPGKVVEILSPGQVFVKKKYFNFGDFVQKDEILFELASPDLQAKWVQIEMDVLEQQQIVEKFKHWQTSPEMIRVKTNLQRARMQLSHANSHFIKTKKLYEAGIIAKEEFLADERIQQESRLNYQNALQYLHEVKQKGNEQFYQLALLKLEKLEEQKGSIVKKRQALNITSPISGIVLAPLRQNDNLDQWGLGGIQKVFQESQSILVIADSNQFSVLIKVDEFDVIHLQKGSPVKIALFAYPSQSFSGKIQEIKVQLPPTKENYQAASFDVKIRIDALPPSIKSKVLLGMSVVVEIPVAA